MDEPLSLRFANTLSAVRGQIHDGIGTPTLLSAWLGSPQTDVQAFVELRDAIRSLITDPDSPAIALVNRLSADAPHWPALVQADGRLRVVSQTTRPSPLATLAQDAIHLLGGELAVDLRACGAPGCVQFFRKDRPRREWCSPACGNRARAARHYLRHREP